VRTWGAADLDALLDQAHALGLTVTIGIWLGHERHGFDNSYGGALSLTERLRDAGAAKPYVLTEFGPPGTWETASTDWEAPYEMTSTDKAAFYRRSYTEAVIKAPGLALGSYVFNWGYKMEATATWYGMFLPDGARLAAVDVMQELWSGKPPTDLAPVVEPLRIDGDARFDSGDKLRVPAVIADPEGQSLRVKWALRRESGDYICGGDFRPRLPDIEDAILKGDREGVVLRLPADPGPYRLFVYAYDEAGNAATANAPLFVNGEVRSPMPFYVYADGFEGMPWAPSGWMGSIDSLSLDGAHADEIYAGSASVRLRYDGEFGWAGIAWQHPVNNWGEQEGGYDLSGANYLELWARGEYGGERVKFGVGLLGADVAYPDSGVISIDAVVLTSEWRRYRVPVKRLDLTSIKTGFVVSLSGRAGPVTVFLDEVRYVR